MDEREVCLRPEYAPWYPAMPSGQWVSARAAQSLVGFQLRYGEPKWECSGRLLSPEHFRFRGGERGRRGKGDRRGP